MRCRAYRLPPIPRRINYHADSTRPSVASQIWLSTALLQISAWALVSVASWPATLATIRTPPRFPT